MWDGVASTGLESDCSSLGKSSSGRLPQNSSGSHLHEKGSSGPEKGSSRNRLLARNTGEAFSWVGSGISGNSSKKSLASGTTNALLTQTHSRRMMNKAMRRQMLWTLLAAVLILAAFMAVGATYVVMYLSTNHALQRAGVEIRRRIARSVMDEVALTLKPAHATTMRMSMRAAVRPGTAQGLWPLMPETIENDVQELLANMWVQLTGDLHLRRVHATGTGKKYVPLLGFSVNIAVQEDMLTPSTNLQECAGVLQAGIFLAEATSYGVVQVTDNPLKFAYRSIISEENGTRAAKLRWTPYQSNLKKTLPNTLLETPVPTCRDVPQMQVDWGEEGARFRWYGPSAMDVYKGVEALAPIKNTEGVPSGYMTSGYSVVFSFNPVLNKILEDGGHLTSGAELAIISQSGVLLGVSGGDTDNFLAFYYNYVADIPADTALGHAFRHLRSEAGNPCPARHAAIEEGERLVDAVPVSTVEYGLPALEERWCVIQTYPRQNMYQAIDSAGRMNLIAGVSMVALFFCATLLFVASLFSALRSDRSLREDNLKEDIRQVIDAAKDVHVLNSPMALVSAADFLQLSKLEHYEALRDRGALTVLDSVEAIAAFKENNLLLFFSHQWLCFDRPDNTRAAQLEAMKGAIRTLDSAEKELYIWCDYSSISQCHAKMQHAAIASLPIYARMADKFIIVAPPAIHEDLQVECNLATYTKRGWCRAEMLAKACGSGIQDMYTCTDKQGTLSPVTREDLSRLSLNIVEGEFTVPEDVETLVKPVLGLYSLVLRERELPHMKIIHAHIEGDKDRFFPERYFSRKVGAKVKLFGKCIGFLEMYVEARMHGEEASKVLRNVAKRASARKMSLGSGSVSPMRPFASANTSFVG